jgi:hypothetical protein
MKNSTIEDIDDMKREFARIRKMAYRDKFDKQLNDMYPEDESMNADEPIIGRLPVCPYCGTKDEEIHDCPAIAFPGDADFHECEACGKEYYVEMVEAYMTQKTEEGE